MRARLTLSLVLSFALGACDSEGDDLDGQPMVPDAFTGAGGGDGGSMGPEPDIDCRNADRACSDGFVCQANADSEYECVEAPPMGGAPGSDLDCRNTGQECGSGFTCAANAEGAYECVPEAPTGGSPGPDLDCRNVGQECAAGFVCQADAEGAYECVPEAPMGGSPGPDLDCRNEGQACGEGFSCQANAEGAYECLPAQPPMGGMPGPDLDCRNEGQGCGDGFACQQTPDGAYECLPEQPPMGGAPGPALDCRNAEQACAAGFACVEDADGSYICMPEQPPMGGEPGPPLDCRNEGQGCGDGFACEETADGRYECLPDQPPMGGEPGPPLDCRNEGRGCGDGFACQENGDGAFECLPEQPPMGGAPGPALDCRNAELACSPGFDCLMTEDGDYACLPEEPDDGDAGVPDGDMGVPEPRLCEPCLTHRDCGMPGARCLRIGAGRFCGLDCADDEEVCPEDYRCQPVGNGHQCVPSLGFCEACADPDGDGYGVGPECLGVDCNEQNAEINAGAVDVCDGLNNDCDGAIDEDFVPEGCGDGECVSQSACVRGEFIPCEAGDAGGAENACDGLDEDCDGRADEGLVAPAARLTDGVCEGAVQLCRGADGWAQPRFSDIDGYENNERSCDGRDNDCDDAVDEALDPPDARLTAGLCIGQVQFCGGDRGWLQPNYAEIPGYEVEETTCDGDDNDCDGRTDESLNAPEASLRVGVCAGTRQVCDGQGGWIDPNFADINRYEAVEVTCDARDNDCDGETDEDLDPPAATLNQGVCAGLVRSCEGLQGFVDPNFNAVDGYEAGNERSCDGADNDCDGRTDEGNPGGGGNCDTGADGICAAGRLQCVGGALECQQSNNAGNEVCNTRDDDCDGETDEGVLNACGACGNVPREVCDGNDNDCDGDTDEGVLNACGGCGNVPREVCDGDDNDCDGETDEGVLNACGACGALPADTCNGQDDDCDGRTDEAFQAQSCGRGACVAQSACQGGQEVACQPAQPLSANDQTCDGVDDDCDGTTDEDCRENLLRFEVARTNGNSVDVNIVYSQNLPDDADADRYQPRSIDMQINFTNGLTLPNNDNDALTLGPATLAAGKEQLVRGRAAGEFSFLLLSFDPNASRNPIQPGVIATLHFTRQGNGGQSITWDDQLTTMAGDPIIAPVAPQEILVLQDLQLQ